MKENRTDKKGNEREQHSMQPDRDTLHTTDPQEKMKGPVSNSINKTGKAFETDESKEHADTKKDKNL